METTNVLEAARAEDRVSALWIIGAAPRRPRHAQGRGPVQPAPRPA
jgi:hypothetical protein